MLPIEVKRITYIAIVRHADHKYIEALLSNNPEIIDDIYIKFSGRIKKYILSNSGSEEEAKDIFQEALIVIFKKAKYENFELSCPFEAYLFMVCRGKWLNVLTSAKKKKETKMDEAGYNNVHALKASEETLLLEKRLLFLESKLTALGEKCQQILKLSWNGMNMQSVAEKLEISYAYSRKKKSECISKLTQLIKEDPSFKELKSE